MHEAVVAFSVAMPASGRPTWGSLVGRVRCPTDLVRQPHRPAHKERSLTTSPRVRNQNIRTVISILEAVDTADNFNTNVHGTSINNSEFIGILVTTPMGIGGSGRGIWSPYIQKRSFSP